MARLQATTIGDQVAYERRTQDGWFYRVPRLDIIARPERIEFSERYITWVAGGFRVRVTRYCIKPCVQIG